MKVSLTTSIRESYQRVVEKIGDSAVRAGRSPDEVRLVVVSKSQPVSVIQAALEVGITRFGENYVEEAVEKIAAIKEFAVEWHMIGHVQSRKAEMVAGNFGMLHSLDSAKLGRKLNRFCSSLRRKLPVLLEFNVSGEESKFGFPAWDEQKWTALSPELEEIIGLTDIEIQGLMTMPPFFDDPERTRPYFKRLRSLQEFLNKRYPTVQWNELSMGTSVDYIAAIQEGATYVRIGQAILGPRIH